MLIEKSTEVVVPFYMSQTADDAPATGLTVADIVCQISKNGGSYAETTNTPVEGSYGDYFVTLTTSETDTDGALILRCWVEGTDRTFANKSATYHVWIDNSHQVYTALPVKTPGSTYVNAVLTEDGANELTDRFMWRDLSDIKDSAVSNLPAWSIVTPLGFFITQMNKIASDDPDTPTVITVKDFDGTTSLATRSVDDTANGTDPSALGAWADV